MFLTRGTRVDMKDVVLHREKQGVIVSSRHHLTERSQDSEGQHHALGKFRRFQGQRLRKGRERI